MVNYGDTPSCPGCYAAANDRKHKTHTPVCRDRIARALSEDESQAHRVIEAKEREDACLENAVKEGDELGKGKDDDTLKQDSIAMNPATPVDHSSNNEVPRSVAMNHEDMLNENDFHDVVNAEMDDQQMYEEIDTIPDDTADMVSAVIGIVQKHVSEVWSQPRVTAMAPKYMASMSELHMTLK